MPDYRTYTVGGGFLPAAAIERSIRAVIGVPGVITDGEYDLQTLGASGLDVGAAALIWGLNTAVTKLRDYHFSGLLLRSQGPVRERLYEIGADRLFRILNIGVATLGTIDLVNGAGAPDEGGDFLAAAQLLEPVMSGVAVAGPDTGRWAGAAADGYAESNGAVMSDLDELRKLDKQMHDLMARQADAVQKAHLTVAGGMNALVLCYPIAMQLVLSCGPAASYAFQIAAVSTVLGGVGAMEYRAVQESFDVGQQVDTVAGKYQKLFTPQESSAAVAVSEAARRQSISTSSAVATIAELAAQRGGDRGEQLHSLLDLLATGHTPAGDAGADSGRGTDPSYATTLPAPPSARPRDSSTSGTAGARAKRPTAEPHDEAAPRDSDAADTVASAGVDRAGTAPVGHSAGDPEPKLGAMP